MNLKMAIDYLRKYEWVMGNGQCQRCFGLDPSRKWAGATEEQKGHYGWCELAHALEALNEPVRYSGTVDRL